MPITEELEEACASLGYESYREFFQENYPKKSFGQLEKQLGFSQKALIRHARKAGIKIRPRGGANNPNGYGGHNLRIKPINQEDFKNVSK